MTRTLAENGTLYTWFHDTALRHPGVTAVETESQAVSYEELDALSGRVAAALVRSGGRRPATVGLLAARGLAGYAGYLAALRLGAAVVPLNPGFPPARNTAVARTAGVGTLVCDEAGAPHAAQVAAACQADLVPLVATDRGDWPSALPAGSWPERCPATPHDIAYTLFTSGSTGAPKGVPIRHRNLRAYLAARAEHHEVGPGARLSQTFELTFDPSVFDLFVTWTSGATLVVPGADEVLRPVEFVNSRRLTHWFSVPSVISLARRLRALPAGSMPGLRHSVFAGEQLTLDQAAVWSAAAPNSAVDNLYGPTELTITCTGYRLPPDPRNWPDTSNGTVPIGGPHPLLEAIVLDSSGTEATEGELCVRGPQRFDGYADPEHGRHAFVRRPERGATVEGDPADPRCYYRTGDRVRRENGQLVHVGRLDDQVKIAGHRVEPSEVEAVLRRHPLVREAVVLPTTAGTAGLHAFYVAESAKEPAQAPDLIQWVGTHLPRYMIPRRFSQVAGFPVNASGKTDRRRLARMAEGNAEAAVPAAGGVSR
ncbi:amino acid adenylation domain-containing protein [Streptomyces sp. NPDC003011]